MKKLLLSAMILCSVHSNAMDHVDAQQLSSKVLQLRVEQLNDFYRSEAAKTPILSEIKLVASLRKRKEFFAKLIAQNSNIGDNEAMYHLICSAATVIIKSPHYSTESPSFYVVEALDPITQSYLAAAKQEMVQ